MEDGGRSRARCRDGLVLVGVALLFAGGGVAWVGVTSGVGRGSSGGSGYLATGPGRVEYLALSGDHGALRGRALTAGLTGRPPAETAFDRQVPVTGALGARRVEVTFPGHVVRSGVRRGPSTFTLAPGGPAGTATAVVFHRATRADLDAALARLVATVQGADRVAEVRGSIVAAGAQVVADLHALVGATGQTAAALAALGPPVATTGDDLSATEAQGSQVAQDVAAASDPTGFGAVDACPDAAVAVGDAGDVVSDAQLVEADAGAVAQEVEQVRQLVASLRADDASLRRRQAALRSYHPSLPTPTATAAAARAAVAAGSAARSTANADLATVNQAVTQADAAAGAAGVAAGSVGCGAPAVTPSVTGPPIS